MNNHIEKAEAWIKRMELLTTTNKSKEDIAYIKEHIATLKWLINKAKEVIE